MPKLLRMGHVGPQVRKTLSGSTRYAPRICAQQFSPCRVPATAFVTRSTPGLGFHGLLPRNENNHNIPPAGIHKGCPGGVTPAL